MQYVFTLNIIYNYSHNENKNSPIRLLNAVHNVCIWSRQMVGQKLLKYANSHNWILEEIYQPFVFDQIQKIQNLKIMNFH